MMNLKIRAEYRLACEWYFLGGRDQINIDTSNDNDWASAERHGNSLRRSIFVYVFSENRR
jgi:hypothetical protein